jgi:U32 family peptidase
MEGANKLEIGRVSHYYGKIGVAVVDLTGELKIGDEILIEGKDSKIKQKVTSMQIEHENVEKAVAGQSIGLKVDGKVKDGYKVYKIIG